MDGLTRVRAVCWDWNGTLLDDAALCRQVMNRVLSEHGLDELGDAAAYRSAFRFPIRDFYADLGIRDALFEPAARRYLELLARRAGEASLHAGAHRTIAAVAGLGHRQVLASATLTDVLSAQMAPHGIADEFEAVLSIDDPFRASKHDAIQGWLDSSGLDADEVLMIGDTNHDREIADALGASFVHFDGGHQVAPEERTRIAALEELIPLLAG